MSRLSDIFEEYNKHTTQAKIDMTEYNEAVSELMSGDPSRLHKLIQDHTFDIDALDKTAKKFGWTNSQLIEGLQNLEDGLESDSQQLKEIEADLKSVEVAAQSTTTGIKKFGNVLKSIFSTVG